MTKMDSDLRKNIKNDFSAGIVVSLVALPLCLGIALASGAPLFSGLIAGLVGGILVGALSGSEVSVSGPAAGLAVIVASSIQKLGSFEAFTLAVVISGAIQFLLGSLRAGILGNYVPNSVIKGMLAGIGLLIILKQIPHALGRDLGFEGDFDFFKTANGVSNTFLDILRAIYSASPAAIGISVVSLLVLTQWEHPIVKNHRFLRWVPGPLVVVCMGVLLNQSLGAVAPGLQLKSEDGHLVSVPVAANLPEFIHQFKFPDFSAWRNWDVFTTALILAIVGSIETLLSLEASDKLDPFRRISDPNRELRAQGVGNFISGLIGGLPITSVIVRSSANVYAGARTRMAAVIHGIVLLVSIIALPKFLNQIPLASLAAILLVIGYKLTRIGLYRSLYAAGVEQFVPFVVTVTAVVFTDLLTGISIGMVVGFFFIVRANHYSAMTLVNQDRDYLLRFNKDVSFIHKNTLKGLLKRIPDEAHLIVDATHAAYVDHDILDMIQDFRESAAFKGIAVETLRRK